MASTDLLIDAFERIRDAEFAGRIAFWRDV